MFLTLLLLQRWMEALAIAFGLQEQAHVAWEVGCYDEAKEKLVEAKEYVVNFADTLDDKTTKKLNKVSYLPMCFRIFLSDSLANRG